MKRQSFAKRRDANEPEIVQALRAHGATVIFLDEFDLLVGYKGNDYKIEVKTPKGKLTESQKKMIETWKGSPLHVVRSVDEALSIVKMNKAA